MEREGAAVTCNGRLFHRRSAATGNALLPTVDTYVERPETLMRQNVYTRKTSIRRRVANKRRGF